MEELFGGGYIFYIAIAVTAVLGVVYNLKVKKTYKYLVEEFNISEDLLDENGQPTGEKDIKNTTLVNIVKDFKLSAKRKTENINTEVIILKNIQAFNKNISIYEKLNKVLPATAIAFGLLGTFIGLVLAIGQTAGVLEDVSSMDIFVENLKAPLASMKFAFGTSIGGVAISTALNLIATGTDKAKDEFYDVIENYLDNVIYGNTYVSPFQEFNNIISSSMINLTKEMRSLFQDGVNELVGKINKNTIDLTGTVKELTNYTKDLDRLTKSLDNSVNNFKEPVESFKISVNGFTNITEFMIKNMEGSISKFSDKVDKLDGNLTALYESVDGNNREINQIGNTIKANSNQLNVTYERIVEMVNTISTIQKDNTDELKKQIVNLNDGYMNFQNGLKDFSDNLRIIQSEISTGITGALNRDMESLTENIVSKLENSLGDVSRATEELTKNSITIGELVKATNELYVTKMKDLQ